MRDKVCLLYSTVGSTAAFELSVTLYGNPCVSVCVTLYRRTCTVYITIVYFSETDS